MKSTELLTDLWRWPGQSEHLEIYVTRSVLADIAAQAAACPHNIGGYLLGQCYLLYETNKQQRHVVIVLACQQRMDLPFCDHEIPSGVALIAADKKISLASYQTAQLAVMGWYHSHHDQGIFLSRTSDRAFHERNFSRPYQIAYVIDLPRKQAGFFIWEDSKLSSTQEQCLALFDPVNQKLVSLRTRHARKSAQMIRRLVSGWYQGPWRDGMIALALLVTGLAVFNHFLASRPFNAWILPGSSQLQWESAGAKTSGYQVYRDDHSAPFSPDTALPIARLPRNEHSLDFENLKFRILSSPGKRFWYRIAALDTAGQLFRWSRTLALTIPVFAPPAAPAGELQIADTRNSVIIKLPALTDQEILGYWLIREGPLLTTTSVILGGGQLLRPANAGLELKDAPPLPGTYRYLVIGLDRSGNTGHAWDSAMLALEKAGRGLLGLF
ncbi:MAG: hypothetical protein HY692_08400 [Cyanobacteria bacterium NC_groundwater_1444_Ag_S-0.65um_54_12]|nr:hypothetical protein [Cyanobacteria bacterium NC_groundwater_1444_Ag_S-0.65um_54_12]